MADTKRRRFLAFDLGAESGRAVLGTLADGKLTLDEIHRFPNPNGTMNGRLQWNLLGQWTELKAGLGKLAKTGIGSPGGEPLHGIGVDTWGVDFGLLTESGEILGNPVCYRDTRTDGILERAFLKVPKAEIYAATGNQFMSFNTLFQLMAMNELKSELLAGARTLLFVPDLFNYLFTGKRMSEFSIASTSQMYDPQKREWAASLLDRLGVPKEILPHVAAPGTVVGRLLESVAGECGAQPGVPVIAPAGHDTGSAVAAVPATGDSADWCYISSGTWSLMGVERDQPLINDKTLNYNYTNEGGVGWTIRFLKNIAGLWVVQECRRAWQREGYDHGYDELTQMAVGSKGAAGGGPLLNLDHAPFLAPGDLPGKIDAFCEKSGQHSPSTRGDYVRACLESLALTYRKTLIGLEDILGRRLSTIHIVGGGSRNELLNQMTADACNRRVVAGPVEGTAIGNILVQAIATGDIASLADARAVVRASFDVKTYEPQEPVRWDRLYEQYLTLTE